MGEGECVVLPDEQPKKSRHRKKHLYHTILQQMEFYFSDSNLSKDRFLSQLLSQSPYIDIDVFLKFNKIRKLNCNIEDIQKALRNSTVIRVSEDGTKVKRNKAIKVNENVDLCTIYVENIKADSDHESLSQIFSDFGNVVYVSIPKYKHNKANKGFAFIEYENEDQAKEAILFFDSIGCKIPSERKPEELQSILTFEKEESTEEFNPISGDIKKRKLSFDEDLQNKKSKTSEEGTDDSQINSFEDTEGKRKEKNNEIISSTLVVNVDIPEPISEDIKKRKLSLDEDLQNKKLKASEEVTGDSQINSVEDTEGKKKKKNKKDKRKLFIKELGMQIMSKKEWKKLRNHYLDLQKKKMKEFKLYLRKHQTNIKRKEPYKNKQLDENHDSTEDSKLTYVPGVIVKLTLLEPCNDAKKLKNEIKVLSSDIKYVDVPNQVGSEEAFLRFNSNEAAKQFCTKDFMGDKTILTDEDEKSYWDKINKDRLLKFQKLSKKQRGREKLLKKADKDTVTHLRFEEND